MPDAGGCCTGLRVEFGQARSGAVGQVPIPGLMNSGVGFPEGTSLPNGSASPGGWAASLSYPGPNPVYAAGAGIIPSPPWVAPNSDSAWLSLAPNDVNAPPGTAWISIPFDLTGLDPATAHIFGRWTADDVGHDIFLNGNPTGNAQVGGFSAWSDFSISPGDGDTFLPGINYLTFQVENGGASNNPAGLRWEILSATAAAVPESSTCAMLAIAGFAAFRRRRA
ncbi:MAG: PEP-CTERM sorting domain-containing protein [Verrucomicrobiales bacterium]|nr:PEP-CTERM sorting domain-containing protein [Verrucomicrobiales bacterium]